MDLRNISREGWLVLFFLFFLATQASEFGALFMLMMILLMARAFSGSNNQQSRRSSRDDRGRVVITRSDRDRRRESRRESRRDEDANIDPFYDVEPVSPSSTRSKSADAVQSHALDAVRAAGRNPDRLPVLPVDIGVLSFKNDEEPLIIRDWDVMDDVDYIQPFVQLRLPQDASGRVRFEIIDTNGDMVFVHEDDYQFVRGRNLVLPSTRLPVHDEQSKEGRWKLRLKADGLLIAEHVVSWADPDETSDDIRRHIAADGEISNELRAMLAESRLEQMSIDDLLADQDEEQEQQARQQRRR